jgi:hypothetical protein
MMLAENGTRFDPTVLEVFLSVRERVESIQFEYLVRNE